jgi:small subunit ribosomal protein S9
LAEEITKYIATGRRKESVATVTLSSGSGKIVINDKPLDTYFGRDSYRLFIKQPLETTGYLDKFDIMAKVKGGGTTGQAGAIRHAVARALLKVDQNLKAILGKAGYLSRDPRMKERKKYGQKGARKRFQWTKR